MTLHNATFQLHFQPSLELDSWSTMWSTGLIMEETLIKSWNMVQIMAGTEVREESRIPEYNAVVSADICDTETQVASNCQEVCGQPDTLFSSQRRLRGCLTLAWLSLAPVVFPDAGDIIFASTEQALETHGVYNFTQFDGRSVLSATCKCAEESCEKDKMGNCTQNFEKCSDFTQGKSDAWNLLGKDLCSGIRPDLNNDIAGPGVRTDATSHSCPTPLCILANSWYP